MTEGVISAIITSLISVGLSVFVLRHEAKRSNKTEFRNQLFKAYGDLSTALGVYTQECTSITGYDINTKNNYDLNQKCQKIFFDLQRVFKKPLLLSDEYLQDMLDKIGELNETMRSNIRNLNCKPSGRIDDQFMTEYTELTNDISKYLDDKIRKMTLEDKSL